MSYFYADAKCPFYQHDNLKESTITCEGFAPGTTVKQHFSGKLALTRQMKRTCADAYERCPWYRLLCVKWAEIQE